MKEKETKNFDLSKLSTKEREDFEFVQKRILALQEFRKQTIYGANIEEIWADADRDYAPHRLAAKGKKIIVTDEDKGWRGNNILTIGSSDWQSDIANANPFIKIQTALALLVDQNPTGVFTPAGKKYQATTELHRQLYQHSWEIAKSIQQLKLFVFNLGKYGWAIARTSPKDSDEFRGIFRENLDPWNAWIDDMARPNNQFSVNDWAWRKVYEIDAFKDEFPKDKYPNVKFVKPGGVTTEKILGVKTLDKKFKQKKLVEVYFYENKLKDLFEVIAGDVPIINEKLPIRKKTFINGKNVEVKRLSMWQAYWNLRHAECPYGIGIYEAIRYDNASLNRFKNMTLDQLALSIYKMFFYQGTQALTESGDIRITPGAGKQVLDPKNINWLDVPGPGVESWKGLELLQKNIDDDSGITETLMGSITGKTAFEIAQAKEGALKRLKLPLDNISEALETEAYLTINLIQLLYTIPETYAISDPVLIDNYLNEIKSDPDLYERDEQGNFTAKIYPEFPLNLENDEKGNLVQTNSTDFFRVKPKYVDWEGVINIKGQSILTPSKQVDKALELEMWNMLIPLMAQPPEIYLKAAKSIVKLYDKDPRDVLPDAWLQSDKPQQPQEEQPLVVPQEQAMGSISGSPMMPSEAGRSAERLTTKTQVPSNKPTNPASQIISKSVQPFRKV